MQLLDISKAFAQEAGQIDASFLASDQCLYVTSYSVPYAPHDDGCVVSLWDAWSRFVRALVLASAAGQTIGAGGSVYVPAVQLNEPQVLLHVRQARIRVTQGEPKWFDPLTLSQIANSLAIPNESVIVAAIGSSSVNLGASLSTGNPIGEIRTLRNFIAHKTDPNLLAAQGYMVGAVRDVHAHLWEKTIGGVERFSLWANVLVAISEAACL